MAASRWACQVILAGQWGATFCGVTRAWRDEEGKQQESIPGDEVASLFLCINWPWRESAGKVIPQSRCSDRGGSWSTALFKVIFGWWHSSKVHVAVHCFFWKFICFNKLDKFPVLAKSRNSRWLKCQASANPKTVGMTLVHVLLRNPPALRVGLPNSLVFSITRPKIEVLFEYSVLLEKSSLQQK